MDLRPFNPALRRIDCQCNHRPQGEYVVGNGPGRCALRWPALGSLRCRRWPEDNFVHDILEDRAGHLWFATAKGVTRYRPDQRPPQTRMVHTPEDTVGYGTSVLTFEFEGGTGSGKTGD